MLRTVALLLCILAFAGCSANPIKDYQDQRKKVVAPVPLNATAAYLTAAHDVLMRAAQSDPKAIPAYVDNDIALIVNNCMDWLALNSAIKQGVDFGSAKAATWENAITGALGLVRTNPALIGAYGIGAAALASTGANITAVVAAPADYDTQSVLLGLVDSCTTQVRSAASTLSFGGAFVALRKCEGVCSIQAAQAAFGKAIQATTLVTHPNTAAIMVLPK